MTTKSKARVAGAGGVLLILALALILIIPGCTKAQDERGVRSTIDAAYMDLSTRQAQPERVIAACETYLTPEFRESLYFCDGSRNEVGFGSSYALTITDVVTEVYEDTAQAVVYFDNDTVEATYQQWSNAVALVKRDGTWLIDFACTKQRADTDPLACLGRR